MWNPLRRIRVFAFGAGRDAGCPMLTLPEEMLGCIMRMCMLFSATTAANAAASCRAMRRAALACETMYLGPEDIHASLSPWSAFSNLKRIVSEGCRTLSDASGAGKLERLVHLDLRRTRVRELLDTSGCSKLKTLYLSPVGEGGSRRGSLARDSSHCTSSPCLSLSDLSLDGCAEHFEVRFAHGLPNLRRLLVANSWSFSDISLLRISTGLRSLSIFNCPRLSDVSAISTCTGLHTLRVRNCALVEDLSIARSLPELRVLEFRGCVGVADAEAVGVCGKLRFLDLSNTGVRSLGFVAGLTELRTLLLENAFMLSDLSPLARLPGLRTVDLTCCTQELRTSELGEGVSVRRLHLAGAFSITDHGFFGRYRSLEWLDLSVNIGLQSLVGVELNFNLAFLDISGCCGLTDIAPLGNCGRLRRLNMLAVVDVSDLGPLAGCKDLEEVNLTGSVSVCNLRPLAQCPSLRFLAVSGCPLVDDTSTAAFVGFEGLVSVDVSRCPLVTSADFLSSSTGLQKLDLSNTSAADVGFALRLRRLTHLDLSRCPVFSISPLRGLEELMHLSLAYTAVRDMTALLACPSLSLLDIRACPCAADAWRVMSAAEGELLVLSSLGVGL